MASGMKKLYPGAIKSIVKGGHVLHFINVYKRVLAYSV